MDEDDVYRLRRHVKALYRRLERERPDVEGLSATALHMLVTLERSPSPLRPGQLAAALEMMDSNVSAALRMLEAQGLVALVSDPEDGRRAFVIMTKKARTFVTSFRHSYNAWLMDAVERHLNAREQRVLIEASELMARLVTQDGKPGAEGKKSVQPAARRPRQTAKASAPAEPAATDAVATTSRPKAPRSTKRLVSEPAVVGADKSVRSAAATKTGRARAASQA